MATKNTADSGRFIYRAPNREIEPYYIPITRSGSLNTQSNTVPPMAIPSADSIKSRTEHETQVRRVVLIRNSKNPQVNQRLVDLGDLGRSKSLNDAPRFTDGNKSIFLIRRPIAPPEPSKLDQERSSSTSLEHKRTPSPPPTPSLPQEAVPSPDPPRPPSARIKSSKRPEHSPRSVPYHRRPRSITRTASSARTNSTRQSSSSDLIHSKPLKRHLSSLSSSPRSSPKQEEPQKTDERRGSFAFYSIKTIGQPVSSPLPAIIEDKQQTIEHHPKSREKSFPRIKSASSGAKSAKSVVLIPPDDQPVSIIENSYVKEERLKSIIKHSKSFKRTRFEDEANDESSEALVKANRWQTCLSCLSRYMCLILTICLLLILIGLTGVGVSAYFLVINSSNNLIPTVVGIAVGGILAITTLCFLCFLLGSIGSRNGFAMIPPTHPNAHLYIPHDHMKIVENGYPVSRVSTAYGVHRQPSSILRRSNTSSNGYEMKSKKNITIEMPERLLTGGQKSGIERERSLNKMVKNIGQIVEDAKKRYNGDVLDKVIVQVDQNASQ